MAMWVGRGFCRAQSCHELVYSHRLCEKHYSEAVARWITEARAQQSKAVNGLLACGGCGAEYPVNDLEAVQGEMLCPTCAQESAEQYGQELRAEEEAYWREGRDDEFEDENDDDPNDDDESYWSGGMDDDHNE